MNPELAEEDRWRAQTWQLLAHLLAQAPGPDVLDRLRVLPPVLDGNQPPLAQAWGGLGEAARAASTEALAEEYQALFIGPVQGEVIPYGSWYLTGFLMEKPLALLRSELMALGIRRRDTVKEPEDHVAALCETHSLLIAAADPRQVGFFARHLAPWLARFFHDLQNAESADFYRAVGALGATLLEVERICLDLASEAERF